MLSSIRSRLLLTYAAVIGVVLCVVGIALVLYILSNPLIDRQAYTRLEGVGVIILRQRLIKTSDQEILPELVQRLDKQGDLRILLISPTGDVTLDSRSGIEVPLNPTIRETNENQRGIAFDKNRKAWYFNWQPLDDNGYLVIASPRIGRISLLFSQRLREVLSDDLLPPLIQGGFAAMILALAFSFWMAHWVSAPLKRMADATGIVSSGELSKVPDQGPDEVRYLTMAFNQMTSQLVASQKSQKDFIANVSHELKTPITSIKGFAQAILDGAVKSLDDLENAANVIHSEAERMHRLVIALLDLARLEAGTIDMVKQPVDLDILLKHVVMKFGPLADAGKISISFSGGNLPTTLGDGDRLMQVFTNFVDNAIKSTPEGGSVTLDSSIDDDQIYVKVQDTGKGIKPDEVVRIFERFYQVDKSRAGLAGRGTGLGLSIAKEIVQAHGGSIHVSSQPGQGSLFMVKIPVATPDESTLIAQREK